MILIGSSAARFYWKNFRQSDDVDYITTQYKQNTDKIEYHIVPTYIYDYLILNCTRHFIGKNILTQDALYTLKLSHLSWEGDNGKWKKHLSDVMWMKQKGCKLIPDMYDMMYKFWNEKFGGKDKIKFTKSPKDFFADSLKRKWDHDKLHQYFAVDSIPAYQNIIINYEESALTSELLFSKLDRRTQLLTVLEEVFVVSFERNLSLSDGFKHVVTRLSKGWWNKFALENACDIIKGFTKEKQDYTLKRTNLNINKDKSFMIKL